MINEETKKKVAAEILKKLHLMKKIGSSHTPFNNLQKGFPSEYKKDVKKIAYQLINRGLLLASKHNYGLGVSLNNKRLLEIEKIITEIFPELKERFKFLK